MGVKTSNLNKIREMGLNVHEYKEIDNIDDLIEYSKLNDKFSIRFDSKDGRHNLPFYTYDKDKNDSKLFNEIINKMNELNCTLLVSNGYKYDNNLIFNFVIDIKDNNDFIFELCSKKVPLRDMYEDTNTTLIFGNLFEDYKTYKIEGTTFNIFSKKNIIDILNIIINHMSIKYIEGTIYDIKVGINNENIVIWQIN